MDFSEKFESWLESVLVLPVPATVVAFSFNLFELESGESKYGIELIGADKFDPDDADWACADAWEANPRSISIPSEFANGGWEKCLRGAKQLLADTLDESSAAASKLKESRAVAIGFIDGDLELIWQR